MSHVKDQVLPGCETESSQCSFGREAAVCPHLEKGAVPSLLELKNLILLNSEVTGCHQTEAGMNR